MSLVILSPCDATLRQRFEISLSITRTCKGSLYVNRLAKLETTHHRKRVLCRPEGYATAVLVVLLPMESGFKGTPFVREYEARRITPATREYDAVNIRSSLSDGQLCYGISEMLQKTQAG